MKLFPSTRVDFVQLDQHFKPFKSALVREALNYAINRKTIVQLAYQGHAMAGSSFMPYKMEFWNSSLKPYPYDPAKAKQLLAQAGYPHGFNTFLITVSGDVAGQAEAIVLKSELAAVGINVSIQSYELLTAYDKEDNGHSEMGERYWTNDIIDPDEVATFGADCKGGANAFNSYWCNSKAISLVNQARAELVSSKRAADVRPDPADRLPAVTVHRHRLQPLPVRRRQLGARVPRDAARQLRPVPGDADGQHPLRRRTQRSNSCRAGRRPREARPAPPPDDEGGRG